LNGFTSKPLKGNESLGVVEAEERAMFSALSGVIKECSHDNRGALL
jgi:hypothetical protein